MGLLFALVVVLVAEFCNDGDSRLFSISELTLELAIAERHKVVSFGLAMKFVISMLFRPIY